MLIAIAPDGSVQVVAHGEKDESIFASLGEVVSKDRGGHVVPASAPLRALFKALRSLPSARLAELTRRFPGQWQTEIIDGPTFGPFPSRIKAVEAEERFIFAR